MQDKKKVVAFHLFNDFSGSPKVLKMALEALAADGYDISLFTSDGGVLDSLDENPRFRRYTIRYRFSSNPFVTIWRLLRSQTVSFFKALKYCRGNDTVTYVNTILPFGAAMGARLAGSNVIYHYHENAFAKGRMYRLLASLMTRMADGIICVSDFQKSHLDSDSTHIHVISNALPTAFMSSLKAMPDEAFSRKTILMVSSLKAYKGSLEFISLASQMPQFHWIMVINASQSEIDDYLTLHDVDLSAMPQLRIYPRQSDLSCFYNTASLVISLTNPELAIETFGLTAAEAMSAGLPVIVPTVGGIADLVTDGYNGYRLDVRGLPAIEDKIREIMSDKNLYLRLAAGALEKSREFREHTFAVAICKVFNQTIESVND